MHKPKTAVIIPSFNVAGQIKDVIFSIPDSIDHIIVVDDKCPELSGSIAEKLNRQDVIVIYHDRNQGVGGAVVTGYKKALELGCDIMIKIDGDGQMDPKHINRLIAPLIENKADYTKGNRFWHFEELKSTPIIRLFGNSVLSFLLKITSGYWNIADPTNGYTAIHRNIVEKLDLDKLSKRYFFESDMIIRLNLLNAVIKDIDIPAKYENENSSLSIRKVLVQFPPKLLRSFIKRIFLRYFIYDFNMASVYIMLGGPLFVLSVLFGFIEWFDSIVTGQTKSAGTIMLIALPIIVSFQMLLQAVNIDINSVPKKGNSKTD